MEILPCESRRWIGWWLSEEAASLTIPETEPMEPTPLVIELMLPWEPSGAEAGGARSSVGLVAWLDPDMDPLDVVLVIADGGRQKAWLMEIVVKHVF